MSISSNNHPINSAGAPDLSFGNSPTKNGTVIARNSGGLSRTLSDGSTITVGLGFVENKKTYRRHQTYTCWRTGFKLWGLAYGH